MRRKPSAPSPLGKLIDDICERLNISQVDIGNLLGCGQPQLSRLRTGTVKANVVVIRFFELWASNPHQVLDWL